MLPHTDQVSLTPLIVTDPTQCDDMGEFSVKWSGLFPGESKWIISDAIIHALRYWSATTNTTEDAQLNTKLVKNNVNEMKVTLISWFLE